MRVGQGRVAALQQRDGLDAVELADINQVCDMAEGWVATGEQQPAAVRGTQVRETGRVVHIVVDQQPVGPVT